MNVNEIFSSIDGEGIRAGSLATFVRLAGCNLYCSYCDTLYAIHYDDGKKMSINDILVELKKLGNKHVTLTGGEPLDRPDALELVQAMIAAGYNVNIETNGSIPIDDYLLQDVIVTMDYKTPSSKMEGLMICDNLSKLRQDDVLKFVCVESDLPRVREILMQNNICAWIYLSPVFGKIQPVRLVDFLKKLSAEYGTEKVRIQLQMHKYIWDVNERGV